MRNSWRSPTPPPDPSTSRDTASSTESSSGSPVLAPGAFLVVCRDEAFIRSTYGITDTVGDFLGELSNDGERVTLVDGAGALVDSVRYEDDGGWPIAADGL